MKRFLWIVPLLALAALWWSIANHAQASVHSTVTLSQGQKVKVIANGCTLSVPSANTSTVKVKCSVSARAPRKTAHLASQITLNPGKSVKIVANQCELQVTKKKPATVIVVCNPQVKTVKVGDGGLTFSPQQINIKVGETVRWTWASSNHTVTSGVAPNVDNVFCSPNNTNCGTANPSNLGATYDHQFNTQGTFRYFCNIHGAAMTGEVVVNP